MTVSIDNGSLRVNGTVDASGERVGSIRLSAKNGLTLDGSAVLDAHGTRLRVDSYGKIIDSPNRAIVELNSGNGQLTLGSGARIDLRHGTDVALGNLPGQNDGRARGTLELNAPRLGGVTGGDIAIDASGPLTIQGHARLPSTVPGAMTMRPTVPTRRPAAVPTRSSTRPTWTPSTCRAPRSSMRPWPIAA